MRIRQRISFLFLLLIVLGRFSAGAAQAQFPSFSGSHEAKDAPAIQFLNTDSEELTRQELEEIRSLFYREPWLFGPDTFGEVWKDLQTLPHYLRRLAEDVWRHNWSQDWLLLLAFVGTLVFLATVIWVDHRFRRLESLLIPLMPQRWPIWLRRWSKIVLVVIGRLALLALLIFAIHVLWGAFATEQRYFPLLVDTLTIFLVYRGIQALFREILVTERDNFFQGVTRQTARKLYVRLTGFALYSSLFWIIIVALQDIAYRVDFIDFLKFIYYASLFIFSVYLISRKAEVFSLFPDIDEPIYQRFVAFFQRFYFYVSGFTLLLGLFWLSGYSRLAQTLFLRSWALVGLVLGVRLGHRFIRHLLLEYLAKDKSNSRLVNTIMRTLSLLEIILIVNGVLSLLGIREPLVRLLVQPIATIGEKSVISPLSFINGLLTLVVFWLISQMIDAFLEERVYPQRFDAGVHQMISLTAFYCIMALGALISLNVIGVDLSVFTIFAGALAFGIGFGLQGIAKNFASGIILIFTGLVKKGDYITVSEQTGYIQDVSWKRVLLRTPDHVDLIIPTVDLVETTIVNWSYSGNNVRIHIPVGVSYNSDMNVVKQALIEAAAEHVEVQKKPEPTVWMTGFGDSSVNFELLVWVDCTRITRERLLGELNFMIWNALARHQIEIPFPQRDLHIRSGLPPAHEPTEGSEQA